MLGVNDASSRLPADGSLPISVAGRSLFRHSWCPGCQLTDPKRDETSWRFQRALPDGRTCSGGRPPLLPPSPSPSPPSAGGGALVWPCIVRPREGGGCPILQPCPPRPVRPPVRHPPRCCLKKATTCDTTRCEDFFRLFLWARQNFRDGEPTVPTLATGEDCERCCARLSRHP